MITRPRTAEGQISHHADRLASTRVRRVPVVEAEQVVSNLKQRGVPVQYVLFPDEGHGWRKVPNRIRSTVEITQWFVKYLGEPKQDAAK